MSTQSHGEADGVVGVVPLSIKFLGIIGSRESPISRRSHLGEFEVDDRSEIRG